MSTQAQIDANRRNAQKSTGPKTAEGKARSSQNSVKHGLLAKSIPMDAPGYEELVSGLYHSLQPMNEEQRFLVDQIGVAMFRISTMESREIDVEDLITKQNPVSDAKVFDHILESNTLVLIHRYMNSYNRQIARNLNLIKQMKTDPAWQQVHQTNSPYLSLMHQSTKSTSSTQPTTSTSSHNSHNSHPSHNSQSSRESHESYPTYSSYESYESHTSHPSHNSHSSHNSHTSHLSQTPPDSPDSPDSASSLQPSPFRTASFRMYANKAKTTEPNPATPIKTTPNRPKRRTAKPGRRR